MTEKLLETAIQTEIQIADSMEILDQEKYSKEIKKSDFFIERTNCVLEKIKSVVK